MLVPHCSECSALETPTTINQDMLLDFGHSQQAHISGRHSHICEREKMDISTTLSKSIFIISFFNLVPAMQQQLTLIEQPGCKILTKIKYLSSETVF